MNNLTQNFLKNGFNVVDQQNAKWELVEALSSLNRTVLVNNGLDSNPALDIEIFDIPYDDDMAYQKELQLQKLAQKYLEEYKDVNDLNWISSFISEVKTVVNI